MAKETKTVNIGPKGMLRFKIPEPTLEDLNSKPSVAQITEASREIKVIREADVIVAGGGPGGFAAAIAAARAGAKTILIERYGHLGGMATGGLVNIIPNLSDIYGTRYIGGICREFIERLTAYDASFQPEEAEWGTTESAVLDYYRNSNFHHFFVRKNAEGQDVLINTSIIDPELAKNEINLMVGEAGVKLLLHSLVTAPIMDGNTVKGVVIESKSGRQAILGKVVIDCTGDGDLLPLVGAKTEDNINPILRISSLCFGFWIGGIEYRAFDKFISSKPREYAAFRQELSDKGLYNNFFRGMLKNQENVMWMHPHFLSNCQTDVEEMTRMEVEARNLAVKTWQMYKERVPGFEKSYIMLTCPQLGTTGGRRLVGEYSLREDDLRRTEPFPDTIAVFPNNDRGAESLKYNKVYVPYRALVPKDVNGLLVGCRAFSSDDEANNCFNLIPHCMCMGQAAGIAAALAVQKNISVKDVPYEELKAILLKQGAILP